MKTVEFEQELKQLDADLSVRIAPANPEMSGIYWKDMYICAIPSNNIYDEARSDYKNSAERTHRTRPDALAIVNKYLWQLKNEEGFMEDEMSFSKDGK